MTIHQNRSHYLMRTVIFLLACLNLVGCSVMEQHHGNDLKEEEFAALRKCCQKSVNYVGKGPVGIFEGVIAVSSWKEATASYAETRRGMILYVWWKNCYLELSMVPRITPCAATLSVMENMPVSLIDKKHDPSGLINSTWEVEKCSLFRSNPRVNQ